MAKPHKVLFILFLSVVFLFTSNLREIWYHRLEKFVRQMSKVETLGSKPVLDCRFSTEKLTNLDELTGETIYMLGDSMVKQQAFMLCRMIFDSLEMINEEEDNDHLSLVGVDKINSLPITELGNDYFLCENDHVRIAYSTQTHRFFDRELLHEMHRVLAKHDNETNQSHKIRTDPTVIYFNGGIHSLYLPGGIPGAYPIDAPYRMDAWFNAEKHAQDYVKEAASIIAPGGRLVYMTSHAIDDYKRYGKVAPLVRQWYENPLKFAQPCIDLLKEDSQTNQMNITHVCIQSAQTAQNLKSLDNRIHGAVAMTAKELDIDIGCVDGYKDTLGKHNDTRDGVHYPPITRMELAGLVDTLKQMPHATK